MDVDKVVKEINQLRNLTKSSKKSLPKVVKRFNTQNLEKKEKPSFRKIYDFSGDNYKNKIKDLANKMSINKNNNH